jgi:hypothetical protein
MASYTDQHKTPSFNEFTAHLAGHHFEGSLVAPRMRASINMYVCSLQVCFSSLQGWGLIDLPLRASNEGSPRPRVARAQKIISLHPLPCWRGCVSNLLGASVGTCDGLLKHRAEAEVGNGIFEVGIQPLEGSHVRIGDVFHR